MKRTFAAVALAAAFVGVAACSTTPTATTPTTAAPTTAAPTTAKAGDPTTTKAGSTGKPTVTKPVKVEKVDKAKVPEKTKKAANVPGISSDESDCIDYVIVQAVTDDPTAAATDQAASYLAGAAIVVCVPQAKIASSITADIKKGNSAVTDAQATCIEKKLTEADPVGITVLIGAVVNEDAAVMRSLAGELDAACGTSLAAAT